METYWWLAINGASCASSPLALPDTLAVVPTPQLLVGFTTGEEQRRAQKMMLTAPIKEVERHMRDVLPAKRKRGEVVVIRCTGSQPPAETTQWIVAPTDPPSSEHKPHEMN